MAGNKYTVWHKRMKWLVKKGEFDIAKQNFA